jgi:hypothetical protein
MDLLWEAQDMTFNKCAIVSDEACNEALKLQAKVREAGQWRK